VLNQLALYPEAHSTLMDAGVVTICQELRPHASSAIEPEAFAGIIILLILCRLFGKQESGNGADLIFHDRLVRYTTTTTVLKISSWKLMIHF